MITIFLLGLLSVDDDLVLFRGTNMFEPISRNEVVVTSDGQVYLLNFQEKFIRHWDAQGKVVNTFGQKGNGPGEFNFPEGLALEGDHLYVNDLGNDQVHCFNTDGSFVESVRLPGRGLAIAKVKGGWATASFMGGLNAAGEVEVKLTDERFDNAIMVLSWPRAGMGGNIVVERNGSGTPKIPINPVDPKPYMAVGDQGRFLYICHPGEFRISVIDTQQKKVVHTIERDDNPIPFNEEYGAERLRQLKENRQGGGHVAAIEFVANFPDNFPVVRNFFLSGDGYLVIEKWTAQPDKLKNNLILDRTGKDQPVPYSPDVADRVVAVQGNYGFLTMHDADDDEGYLAKCTTAQIDRVAAANPINGERAPRMLMRMN